MPLAKYETMELSVRFQYHAANIQKDPSLVGDIVISSTMFKDHMPDVYESCMERIYTRDCCNNERATPHKTAESIAKGVLNDPEM